MAQSYQQRMASGIGRYLDAHPEASLAEARKFARGHGNTPEHGKAPAARAVAGREVYSTTSGQAAERIIAQAAREGKRVSVSVTDRNNPQRPVSVWTNPGRGPGGKGGGISAKYIRNQQKQSGQGLKRYLEGTTFARSRGRGGSRRKKGPTPGYKPQGITSIQVTVY